MTSHVQSHQPVSPEIVSKSPDGIWCWQPLKNALPVSNPQWLIQHFKLAGFHPDQIPAAAKDHKQTSAPPPPLAEPEIENIKADYPGHIQAALNALSGLEGLRLEVIGSWVWAFDKFENHADDLNAQGFRFSPRKSRWYLRPPNAPRQLSNGTTSIDAIRNKYGSDTLTR